MTCPTCGRHTDDLVCRPCFEKRARRALLEFERQYTERMLSGALAMTLARRRRNGNWPLHPVLRGDPSHAWCGEYIDRTFKITKEEYSAHLQPYLCKACWHTLETEILLPTEVRL